MTILPSKGISLFVRQKAPKFPNMCGIYCLTVVVVSWVAWRDVDDGREHGSIVTSSAYG